MTKTDVALDRAPAPPGETAASSYHLSNTLDWSSLAAQIKNQTFVLEVDEFPAQPDFSTELKPSE